jgi:hypothetical protein
MIVSEIGCCGWRMRGEVHGIFECTATKDMEPMRRSDCSVIRRPASVRAVPLSVSNAVSDWIRQVSGIRECTILLRPPRACCTRGSSRRLRAPDSLLNPPDHRGWRSGDNLLPGITPREPRNVHPTSDALVVVGIVVVPFVVPCCDSSRILVAWQVRSVCAPA